MQENAESYIDAFIGCCSLTLFSCWKNSQLKESLPTLVSSGENICGEFEREILKGTGWNFKIFFSTVARAL